MNIMSKNSWIGRRWKLILNVITLIALLVLVYAIRKQLGDTLRNLAHVHAWILLLIIPVEALNYHSQTKMYQRLFRIVGNRLSYKYLYKTSLELNFVNHVFPSGGVTGVSYFGIRMRDGDKLSSGKATLVQVMKLGLTFLSFEILIIFGLFCLAIMGRVNNLVILVAGSLSTLLVVGTVGFVYVVGSKTRINGFFTFATKGINRLIHVVRPQYPETISIKRARKVFDDFHNNYEAIEKNTQQLKSPFWYALLANITEVAALYVVFLAFGKPVNVGAVILAYGIANFAGLVSVLPGGVGIYEALMTAVLASTGVSPSVSLPVVIMYRVVNTIIQIPPGYYLYQQNLSHNEQPPGASGAT
jgi:uncharacterized protein (TIRG00374 family)